jgi:hypothetical protein
MTSKHRPLLRLRLTDDKYPDGEIPLQDLAQIATETQRTVRRLGRALVARPGPGRATSPIEEATELSLVGLEKGSTVLKIAGPDIRADQLALDEMPPDLSERALEIFVDGLEALNEGAPVMPLGFDEIAKKSVSSWLQRMRKFHTVGISLQAGTHSKESEINPATARSRLRTVQVQPSVPFVTATEQAVEGILYSLNIRTGTYGIEDDSGQRIRLNLPDEIRSEAAVLVTRRVRAIGNAEIDERGRLRSFKVSSFHSAPAIEGIEQGRFFQRHPLNPPPAVSDDLGRWAIQGLSEEEADSFLASLSE